MASMSEADSTRAVNEYRDADLCFKAGALQTPVIKIYGDDGVGLPV